MCSTASSLSRSCFTSGRVTCHVRPQSVWAGRGSDPAGVTAGGRLSLNRLTDLSSKFAAQFTLRVADVAPDFVFSVAVVVLSI